MPITHLSSCACLGSRLHHHSDVDVTEQSSRMSLKIMLLQCYDEPLCSNYPSKLITCTGVEVKTVKATGASSNMCEPTTWTWQHVQGKQMFDTQSLIINVILFTLITNLNMLWEKYNMERGSYLGWVSFSTSPPINNGLSPGLSGRP